MFYGKFIAAGNAKQNICEMTGMCLHACRQMSFSLSLKFKIGQKSANNTDHAELKFYNKQNSRCHHCTWLVFLVIIGGVGYYDKVKEYTWEKWKRRRQVVVAKGKVP